ncbi:hypothetical protein, partial [Paenibacillus sp. 3LSP]|uniref:hypothetical protein n=1 Tax=Paenibacillus sp. 3LSP TaxID=2800795 RepID=UPI002905ABD6
MTLFADFPDISLCNGLNRRYEAPHKGMTAKKSKITSSVSVAMNVFVKPSVLTLPEHVAREQKCERRSARC